jgi:hypothetical protein
MSRTSFTLLLSFASFCFAVPAIAVAAEGKCNTVQAQCAVEIGGRCDPSTGHWCYGPRMGRDCGGSNRGGAFDACVARKLGQKK